MMVEELRQITFHGLRQIGVSWHLLTGGWLDRLDRRR